MPEYSIHSPTDAPASTYGGTDLITVGTLFSVSEPGNAVGIRYYQQAGDVTHGHLGILWRVSDGANLVQVAFDESAPGWGTTGGWQEIRFTGILLSVTDSYITSVYYPGGFFNYTSPAWPTTVGPITGTSGQYNFASGVSYPASAFAADYFQDIIFSVGNDISGSVTIAAKIALTPSARQQQHASASITRAASVTATSRVNRPGSVAIAPHSGMTNTAKAIHNNLLVTIARAITVVASGSTSTQGTASLNLGAHATVVPNGRILMKGQDALVLGATVAAGELILRNSTVSIAAAASLLRSQVGMSGILAALSMLAIPNQVVKPSPQGVVGVGAGISMRAASYTLHNASVQIQAGRPGRVMTTVHAGATLSCVAHNKIGGAGVRISTGLNTNPRTTANLWWKTFITAFDTCQNRATVTIGAGASIVASGFQSHTQTTIATKATVTPTERVIFFGHESLQCGATINAVPTVNSFGPQRGALVGGVAIGATEQILRRATASVGGGMTLACRGSVKYSVHAALTPGRTVVANGIPSHAVSIAIINAGLRILAQMSIKFGGRTTAGGGSSIAPVAMNIPYVVSVMAPYATVTANGQTVKLYQAFLGAHATVVATGKAIHVPTDIIRAGALLIVTALTTHRATTTVAAAASILARATNATSSTNMTIAARSTVGAASFVRHSAASILAGLASLTATSKVMRQVSLGLTPGATIGPVAQVVHNTVTHVAAGMSLSAGVGHQSLASDSISAGATFVCHASVQRNASTGVGAGVSIGDLGHVLHDASLTINAGSNILTSGGKGIEGQVTIHAQLSAVLVGLSSFFGSAQNVVTDNKPGGAVTSKNPKGNVTQTS